MNLLLLLSALLSALTGTSVGVRAPAVPTAIAARVAAQVAPRRAIALPHHPLPTIPALADVIVAGGIALTLTPAQPAFADRRRE